MDIKYFIDSGYNATEREIIDKVVSNPEDILKYMVYNPETSHQYSYSFKYRETKDPTLLRINLHHGQRKLYIAEVRALTDILLKYNQFKEKLVVLYAGGGPGNHIPYLSEKFPNIDFILVDPAGFRIKPSENIKLIKKYFVDNVMLERDSLNDRPFFKGKSVLNAEDYIGKVDIFISDIRALTSKLSNIAQTNIDIRNDLENQARWVKLIKPKFGAILKFRFPFDGKPMSYLKGEIQVQSWSPQSSTETRLIVEPNVFEEIIYNAEEYDNYFAFHNYVVRSWLNFKCDPVLFKTVRGFCGCYDCSSEVETWKKYILLSQNPEKEISYYINTTSHSLYQPLFFYYEKGKVHPHGSVLPNVPFLKKREEIYRLYQGFKLSHYEV